MTFAVGLLGAVPPEALWQGLLGLVNGLLSLMLAMVLLPLLEDAFNILTPMKLLELSNTGNTLLHKLLQKAPGTFTHSMQVGSLADAAAERVGADPLLARVGAYYHDIGKMEHPAYFIENQIAQVNPHATLSPALSAKVIKRHVKDGLEIGRAWGLPQEILDHIAQHHGSTRIEYFYRKALEEALDDSEVNEADFRYSSGLPHSKEAGILMLADSIEATVKALPKPTPKRIEDVVADTIKRKLEDGQFDESDLTMHDIHEAGRRPAQASSVPASSTLRLPPIRPPLTRRPGTPPDSAAAHALYRRGPRRSRLRAAGPRAGHPARRHGFYCRGFDVERLGEVSVALVDPGVIRDLNLRFRVRTSRPTCSASRLTGRTGRWLGR